MSISENACAIHIATETICVRLLELRSHPGHWPEACGASPQVKVVQDGFLKWQSVVPVLAIN